MQPVENAPNHATLQSIVTEKALLHGVIFPRIHCRRFWCSIDGNQIGGACDERWEPTLLEQLTRMHRIASPKERPAIRMRAFASAALAALLAACAAPAVQATYARCDAEVACTFGATVKGEFEFAVDWQAWLLPPAAPMTTSALARLPPRRGCGPAVLPSNPAAHRVPLGAEPLDLTARMAHSRIRCTRTHDASQASRTRGISAACVIQRRTTSCRMP